MAGALPKVVLFDIGGVCVLSPMSAISSYESENGIPQGWINYAISASAPTGAWHHLERGQIPLDSRFFEAFKRDLRHEGRWLAFQRRVKDRNIQSMEQHYDSRMDDNKGHYSKRQGLQREHGPTPPLPDIDSEQLFWNMMRVSRQPDPYMYPAVKRLKASGKFVIAALSNTVIFPPGHPYGMPPRGEDADIRATFDIFVSSAHVGQRKPEASIYYLAAKWVEEEWRRQGGEGPFEPSEILFLDDIGSNLRTARRLGFQTIKVGLGNTQDAVKQVESITGMQLLTSERDSQAKL